MEENLRNAFVTVWQQAMRDESMKVEVEARHFPVKKTSRHRLRQVDFIFDGRDYRGLEQNPETSSRWAKMAREGKRVMQFLSQGRYLAVVADGKVFEYGSRK